MGAPEPVLEMLAARLEKVLREVEDRDDELDDRVRTIVDELAATVEQLQAAQDDIATRQESLGDDRRELAEDRRLTGALFDEAPYGYLVTLPDGTIVQANPAAARLLDGTQRDLMGHSVLEYLMAEHRRSFFRSLSEARRGVVIWQATFEPARRPAFPAVVRIAGGAEGGRLRWLVQDVTEEERRDAAARADMAQLEADDAGRRAYVLGVAHDLQSPIAAILALVQSGLSEASTEDGLRDVLVHVEHSAHTLRRIQHDLLDLERVSRRVVRAVPRPTALDALVAQALPEVDLGRRHLEVDVGPEVVDIDPGIVRGIVVKLLENARQHTPPGTRIWVRTEVTADEFVLVVEDDGPGIADVDREAVFGLYWQGDEDSAPGLGVGLYLVRHFAELHGGGAALTERPGGGASFRVKFQRSEVGLRGAGAPDRGT